MYGTASLFIFGFRSKSLMSAYFVFDFFNKVFITSSFLPFYLFSCFYHFSSSGVMTAGSLLYQESGLPYSGKNSTNNEPLLL